MDHKIKAPFAPNLTVRRIERRSFFMTALDIINDRLTNIFDENEAVNLIVRFSKELDGNNRIIALHAILQKGREFYQKNARREQSKAIIEMIEFSYPTA